MKRRVAFIAASLALLVSVGLGVGGSAASAAKADDPAWIKDFKDCQEQNRQTAILFLLDESKSLRDGKNRTGSDPTHARVASVKAALTALVAIAPVDNDGKPFQKLFVAIDGFGRTYHSYGSQNWAVLDGKSLAGFVEQASAFVSRTEEQTTDYRQALRGAGEAMARYRQNFTSGSPADACQLVVWFTDGAYDTEDNVEISDHEVRQIEEEICNGGGLADQLRVNNVLLLATGLSNPASPPDFTWLRKIATADGCGAAPRRGDLAEAQDPNTLLDAILRPPIGPSEPPTQATDCPQRSDTCAEISFKVAPWITNFRLLVQSNAPNLEVTLLTPGNGDEAQILAAEGATSDKPTTVAPGVTSTVFTSQRSLLIADRTGVPDTSWVGAWTIRFKGKDAAKGAATLAFVGAVRARFEEDTFDRAKKEDLVLVVEPQDAPSGDVESDMSAIKVDIVLQAGDSLTIKKDVPADGRVVIAHSDIDDFMKQQKVLSSGKLYASVAPHAEVSLPEGTVDVPIQAVETSIHLRTGDGYPEVGDVSFAPAMLDNATSGSISVQVKGPRQGDGTVTSKGFVDTATADGFQVETTSCAVPKDQVVTCFWKVTTEAPANRTVRLGVLLEATGTAAEGDPIEYREAFGFEMKRPLNQSTLVRTLVILIGLFLVIQIAMKTWSILEFARFNQLDPTSRVANLPVVVGADGSVRSPSGGPVSVSPADLPFAFDFHSPFQSKDALGLHFEVSRLRALLFHPTFGVVSGGAPVLTQDGFISPKTGVTGSARISLSLQRRWILAFADGAPTNLEDQKSARLIVFLAPIERDPADEQISKALNEIADSQHVQRLLEHVQAAHESQDPVADPDGVNAGQGEQPGSTVDAGSPFDDPYATVQFSPSLDSERSSETGADREKRRARRQGRRASKRALDENSETISSTDVFDDDPYR